MRKKKLLWVGDAGVATGFAVATHGILETLRESFDVTVLGINYLGDSEYPPRYPYPIHAAMPGGDSFGVGRLLYMCERVRPDLIVLQNDGWNIQMYLNKIRQRLPNGEYLFPDHAAIPVVAALAVDGKNFQGKWLQGIQHAIFWTQFALDEAREGVYEGSASVIPLGVDLNLYYPEDKGESRRALGLPEFIDGVPLDEIFFVGNVNRNQQRKRWDLTIKYFARWIKEYDIRNAWLFAHSALSAMGKCDIVQLASYYGVVDRLAHIEPEPSYGRPEEMMRATYNSLDVLISTTQGEGFGLPALEAMACGVPCILPDWSAYGEWAKDAALLVSCSATATGIDSTVIGGIADEKNFVHALEAMYRKQSVRETYQRSSLMHARRPEFRWQHIGESWNQALTTVLEPAGVTA